MTAAAPRVADLTPLSDRMGHLLALRFVFGAVVVAWSLVRPEALGAPLALVALVSGAYLATTAMGEGLRRQSHRGGLVLLSALLLVDGLYLAFVMYATGGTESPMRFLVYLHLVAVSLLASYRTGLKIALWHSLLLFVVLYAQAAELVPAVDVVPGRELEFERTPLLNVTSFWLFALATSLFSAMNERELRQRRSDLQTLVEVGARLDEVRDPIQQAQTVMDCLAETFGIRRGVVLGVTEEKVLALAGRAVAEMPTTPHTPDAVIELAWRRKEPLAVRRLDEPRNPLLAWVLPDARNLLVAPMIVDGHPVGAIVIEHGPKASRGVERRVTSVLAQFGSMAGLNLRNAALLRHVQDLAERDSLTGAANRRMFQVALEDVIERGRHDADPGSSPAVLFIDLDDFKIVNDSLGHRAGDELLTAVTERIHKLVRQGDLVARLGGDEFAILTDDDDDLARSRAMAERLVRELQAPYEVGGEQVTISASIGIASARDPDESAGDVVRNADVAMYMAKAGGKAGFAVFDPGMHAAMVARHEIGSQLQRAVALGQLRVFYQPIVAFETGRTAAVEALLRWDHPERGLVEPQEFIEIAEENGAIIPIGRWVLREAVQQVALWRRHDQAPHDMALSVNVSAREIQQPEFVQAVVETLGEAGLPPSSLVVELTETALLRASPVMTETLDALRGLGVRVVIDDFGTGYFSLSHLRQFPVDALKIASEFVQITNDDSRSAALAKAIVAMSDSLGIETVAEGIETVEQAERMRSFGCAFGQGYLFATPMPEAQLVAMLAAAPRQPDGERERVRGTVRKADAAPA